MQMQMQMQVDKCTHKFIIDPLGEIVCELCGLSKGFTELYNPLLKEGEDESEPAGGGYYTYSFYVLRKHLGTQWAYWNYNGSMNHVKKIVKLASLHLYNYQMNVEEGLRDYLICLIIDYVMYKIEKIQKQRKLRWGESNKIIEEALKGVKAK